MVEPELEVNLGNVSDKIEAMCLNTILILNFLSAKHKIPVLVTNPFLTFSYLILAACTFKKLI